MKRFLTLNNKNLLTVTNKNGRSYLEELFFLNLANQEVLLIARI